MKLDVSLQATIGQIKYNVTLRSFKIYFEVKFCPTYIRASFFCDNPMAFLQKKEISNKFCFKFKY